MNGGGRCFVLLERAGAGTAGRAPRTIPHEIVELLVEKIIGCGSYG